MVDNACQRDQPGVRPPSHLVLVETLGLAKDCLAQELEPREQKLSLIGHGSWKGDRRETVVPRCFGDQDAGMSLWTAFEPGAAVYTTTCIPG